MCDSIAQGGYRCAAHTRPRFQNAPINTPAWEDAAADYAATPSGKRDLERLASDARRAGDIEMEAALTTALRVGEGRRQAYKDIKAALDSHRISQRQTHTQGDDYWAAEMLDCIYSADHIVDRDEETFFDLENPVEIAAARQHLIDLYTAAENISAAFQRQYPQIPWAKIAAMRHFNAHNYDKVNRNIVWQVLINEYPKIRAVLRDHLRL